MCYSAQRTRGSRSGLFLLILGDGRVADASRRLVTRWSFGARADVTGVHPHHNHHRSLQSMPLIRYEAAIAMKVSGGHGVIRPGEQIPNEALKAYGTVVAVKRTEDVFVSVGTLPACFTRNGRKEPTPSRRLRLATTGDGTVHICNCHSA